MSEPKLDLSLKEDSEGWLLLDQTTMPLGLVNLIFLLKKVFFWLLNQGLKKHTLSQWLSQRT